MSKLKFKIENGILYWSEDNGCSWEAAGEVVTPGQQGPQGETGETGAAGQDGADGEDGAPGFDPYINQDGYWVTSEGVSQYKAAGTTYTVEASAGDHIDEVGTPTITQTRDDVNRVVSLVFDYLKGEPGDTPVITTEATEDGYNILVDGEVVGTLYNGEDGDDGTTPLFRVVDGELQVSYDEGTTWETLLPVGDSSVTLTYYNTASSEGIQISTITSAFLGVICGTEEVKSENVSLAGITAAQARSIINGQTKNVFIKVPGDRGFRNNSDFPMYVPATIILDNSSSPAISCLLIGQGYKAQTARVIDSSTSTVTQELAGEGDPKFGLSPVLYCINLIYDDNLDEYNFYGFVIYPKGNFGLFGEADTI